MTKVYYVVCDRQGGSFGMGRLYDAYEWLEQAVDWSRSDGMSDEDLFEFTYEWLHEINNGNEEKFMEFISDFWEIDFAEGSIEEGIPTEYDPWEWEEN